jgi:lipopolysaccharide transport system ATP-binding protein
MSDIILKVENVSKLYRLGTLGTGTFGGDIQRFWKTKILGQEDPFLKIGQTNDRTSKEKADFVWALQDINFEVKRGEVLGIIGKNGAGKSTLLKLLSRITSPTTGSIKSAGRMASLLEVGTGFHPELTGRENIFLNGAILGMTKKEIQSKFDEIVDFSGCALYIDTPTKRYSSGMTVRLGFAVAAFLDPEILVVDEVLAVGDAEFQNKAIGKMKDVSASEGRTVLFVSHNMGSIKQLCSRAIVMMNGSVGFDGHVNEAVEFYLNNGLDIARTGIIPLEYSRNIGNGKVKFTRIELFNERGFISRDFLYTEKILIKGKFCILERFDNGYNISVIVGTTDSQKILFGELNSGENSYAPQILVNGVYEFELEADVALLPGNYSIYLAFCQKDGTTEDWLDRVYDFTIQKAAPSSIDNYRWQDSHGFVKFGVNWSIKKF